MSLAIFKCCTNTKLVLEMLHLKNIKTQRHRHKDVKLCFVRKMFFCLTQSPKMFPSFSDTAMFIPPFQVKLIVAGAVGQAVACLHWLLFDCGVDEVCNPAEPSKLLPQLQNATSIPSP